MSIKAKFKCNSVTKYVGGENAELLAVYGQEGENADFTKATPSGDLRISIDSGVPASGFFIPGKSYYLTFDEVDGNKKNKEIGTDYQKC